MPERSTPRTESDQTPHAFVDLAALWDIEEGNFDAVLQWVSGVEEKVTSDSGKLGSLPEGVSVGNETTTLSITRYRNADDKPKITMVRLDCSELNAYFSLVDYGGESFTIAVGPYVADEDDHTSDLMYRIFKGSPDKPDKPDEKTFTRLPDKPQYVDELNNRLNRLYSEMVDEGAIKN